MKITQLCLKETKEIDMGILSWVILGLIVGIIAKFFMPGRDPGGIFITNKELMFCEAKT